MKELDSTKPTLKHIIRIRELLLGAASELMSRGGRHDKSKLESPEKKIFDKFPKLKAHNYGSKEYKNHLKEMKKAIDHHYLHNSHHPEHYPNGVEDMDLFDIVEMFFDWKASTEREDGDIYESIKIQKKRYKLSNQLVHILNNTAKNKRWKK